MDRRTVLKGLSLTMGSSSINKILGLPIGAHRPSIFSETFQAKPKSPVWLRSAVFYQVYPQSFYDSDSDGTGDLVGLISKLDYIRSIGCNVARPNPIFESPFGDAGYDVADFFRVASRYGSNDDVVNLCRETHKRDMKICLDLVAGHTSIQHPWFRQAMMKERNKYSDWYIWIPSSENVQRSFPVPASRGRNCAPKTIWRISFPFNLRSITDIFNLIHRRLGSAPSTIQCARLFNRTCAM